MSPAAIETDRDLIPALLEGDAFGTGLDRDIFCGEDVTHALRHVGILASDDLRSLLDDRYARTETAIGLRELEADVAAADDHQVFRQHVQMHDRRVREVGHVAHAGHRRHERAAADVDEDLRRFERVVVHLDRRRRREPGVSWITVRFCVPRNHFSTFWLARWTIASLRALTFFMSTRIGPSIVTP